MSIGAMRGQNNQTYLEQAMSAASDPRQRADHQQDQCKEAGSGKGHGWVRDIADKGSGLDPLIVCPSAVSHTRRNSQLTEPQSMHRRAQKDNPADEFVENL